jgi:hypothetical protein
MNSEETKPNEFVSIPVEEFNALFEFNKRYSKARIMGVVPKGLVSLISEQKIDEILKHSNETLFPVASSIVEKQGEKYKTDVAEWMKKKTEETMLQVSDNLQMLTRG